MTKDIKKLWQHIPELKNKSGIIITPVTGGLTNRNYKITADKNVYFLRLSGPNSLSLNIDRFSEYQAMKSAYEIGISSEVLYLDQKEGCILSRFIEGQELTKEQYCHLDTLKQVVNCLKTLHSSKAIKKEFNPFNDIRNRIEMGLKMNYRIPVDLKKINIKLDEVENYIKHYTDVDYKLCHNDAYHSNFIQGEKLFLIDWEYAGMGDIFFDLASIANFTITKGNLENTQLEKFILTTYFQKVESQDLIKLRKMRFVVCLWNASWAIIQHQFSDIDHNFLGMSNMIFKRAEALMKIM